MTRKTILLLVAAGTLLILATQSAYVVDQTETAVVLELGKPVSGAIAPGLHFKLPLVQNVIFFDSRLLDYDAKPAEVLTKDKKAMVVDNYCKWRITDPLQFYMNLKSIPGAQARLDDIVYAEMRVALGQFTLIELVSERRKEIMGQITDKCRTAMAPYGIEVVDVRIKRTDLPPENERAIFGRMKAERERQAKQYRSEGREAEAKIRAQADRDRAVTLAEANREAEVTQGEGDAQAARIYAQAYSQSPDLYSFKRSLDAYEKSFKENTRAVLSPGGSFLKHMQ